MAKLTAEGRKKLQELAGRPDREIDLTDIPEIQEIPSDAVIGRFYRPKKNTVTIRLDADVLAWLKGNWRRIPDPDQCLPERDDAAEPIGTPRLSKSGLARQK